MAASRVPGRRKRMFADARLSRRWLGHRVQADARTETAAGRCRPDALPRPAYADGRRHRMVRLAHGAEAAALVEGAASRSRPMRSASGRRSQAMRSTASTCRAIIISWSITDRGWRVSRVVIWWAHHAAGVIDWPRRRQYAIA